MAVTTPTSPKPRPSFLERHPNATAQVTWIDSSGGRLGSGVWIPEEKCLYTVRHVFQPIPRLADPDPVIRFCVDGQQTYADLKRRMRHMQGTLGNILINNAMLGPLNSSVPGTERPFISPQLPAPANARTMGFDYHPKLHIMGPKDGQPGMSGGPVISPNGAVHGIAQSVRLDSRGNIIPGSSMVLNPHTGERWNNYLGKWTGKEDVHTVLFHENGHASVTTGPISSRSAPPPAAAPRPRTTPEPPQQDETPGPGIPNHTLKWQRPCRDVLPKFAEAFGPANVTDAPDFKNGSVITDPNTNDAYLLQDEPLNGGSACVNMGGASTASLKDNPIYQRMR